MKEFVDQERTRAKEVRVKPNPKFDRGNDETDKNLEEEDVLLGTIHIIGGPNHPNLENIIQGVGFA